MLTREVLDRFARHYNTGQALPQALVDCIARALGSLRPPNEALALHSVLYVSLRPKLAAEKEP